MSDNDQHIHDPNRRVWDRLSVSRKMLFELANGDILIGHTEDISLRGVLMNIDSLPAAHWLGAAGTLFVLDDDGQHGSGYPCKVVRLKGTCIALELEEKVAAAFANCIAKGLLKR